MIPNEYLDISIPSNYIKLTLFILLFISIFLIPPPSSLFLSLSISVSFLTGNDILKIEDILPLFPDFTTIDDFKTEICEALEEYNEKIDELKDEMKDYVDSAKDIRKDIKNLKLRSISINKKDKCQLCGIIVNDTNFYTFPDKRVYHCNCLIEWVLPNLSEEQRTSIKTMKSKIELLNRAGTPQTSTTIKEKEHLRLQIDDIIASGWLIDHIMIDHIDKPFVMDDAGWDV